MTFVIISLFGGILLFATLASFAQVRRAAPVRTRWRTVSGKVLEFGVSHRVPEVLYEYEVDGERYESRSLVVGRRGTEGGVVLKKVYLDERGRLRFPPGGAVRVYVNPSDPTDAALHHGVGFRVTTPPLLLLMFVGLVMGGYQVDLAFLKAHREQLGGTAMMGVGGLLLVIAFLMLLKHLRSRDASSTEGTILDASVEQGQKGYALQVRYEYEVGGVRYRSRQLYALATTYSGNREQLEKEAAALRADPRVRVWYHPHTPWEAFLRQGPPWLFLMVGLMGAVFLTLGSFILSSAK